MASRETSHVECPEAREWRTEGSKGGYCEVEGLRWGSPHGAKHQARSMDPDTRLMRSHGRILRGEIEPLKKSPRASSNPSSAMYKRVPSRCYRGTGPQLKPLGWTHL